MLNETAEAPFSPFRLRSLLGLLLWRRIEPGAVNGPEMAFCVQNRGAALSSVSMLSRLFAGGMFICGAGFYALRRDGLLPVFSPPFVI